MAFGKPTEVKRIKNAVLEDQLWRAYVLSEEKVSHNWDDKWHWILDEYKELHGKLEELSKKSSFLSEVNKLKKETDTRTINPIPEATNHEYGWLPSKSDFNLEKYGPDVDKGLPLPKLYHIVKK